MNKLNVFVITQQEPFYIPKVVQKLLEEEGQYYRVVGAACLKPHRKNKSMRDWFRERSRIYTNWELFITGLFFAFTKIKSGIFGDSRYSVKKTFRTFGVDIFETEDINHPDFLKTLEELQIDVIVSISSPQLFSKDLLTLPSKVCINAHGTLLPRHRGVFGSWWMLYEEDEDIGSTIHTMEERLDAGEIIWQRAKIMPRQATQFSIAYHTKKLLAKGIVESLEKIYRGSVEKISSPYTESYHRAPTPDLARKFRAKGKRIIKWRDGKYALAKTF